MNKTIIIAFIILSSAICSEDLVSVDQRTGFPCAGFQANTGSFYAFNINTKASKKLTLDVNSFSYQGRVWNGIAIVDLCTTEVSSDSECTQLGKDKAIGYLKLKDSLTQELKCIPLSDTNGAAKWSIISQEESTTKNNGSSIGFQVSQTTPVSADLPFKVSFDLGCSLEAAKTGSISGDSEMTIRFADQSSQYCGHNTSKYIGYLKNSKFVSIFLIAVSIFMIFFGIKFIKLILFKMGFLFGFFFTISIAVSFNNNPVQWKTSSLLLVGFLAVMVGALAGYLFARFTKFYLMLAGGFFGYAVSFKTFELFSLVAGTSNETYQIITIVACIILGTILGYFLHDHIFILSTAFGGSFILCVAVGTLIGNYPDISTIQNFKNMGSLGDEERTKLVRQFLIYSLAWLVVGILGAVVQYKVRAEKKVENPGKTTEETDYLNYNYYGYNQQVNHHQNKQPLSSNYI